jgi:molybdopterin molybdotransferase
MTLLSVQAARERILARLQPIATETLPLIQCANRVLAQDIPAATDLPLFDNSAMDGFAVRSVDTVTAAAASTITLNVVADIPAGSNPQLTLAHGQAARIMTGAPIPDGADAVIPVEDTNFNYHEAGTPAPATVTISRVVKIGENIRPRGMDIHQGSIVLHTGRSLRPQDLGMLAMSGIAQVRVHKKARAALFSSGDELLELDAPLQPGKIRDSNSYTLASLAEDAGAEVIRLGIAKDTRESVEALFEGAADSGADLILSSAGVSVGAFDFIKEVIESNGRLDFWRVNMRPGKPLAFGEYRGIPFFGLPGNPVSAFVGFEVFVRPAIGKLNGLVSGSRPKVRVRLAEEIESDGRESYLRAEIQQGESGLIAKLTGHQGSGNLLSLIQANALLIIPAGVKCVPAGREVDAWLL